MAATGSTLADLQALAHCDAGAPPLLVLTIGVQMLDGLVPWHRRGVAHGGVRATQIRLEGVSPRRLLAEPGRDPRVRLGEPCTDPVASRADDLAACGALLAGLLGARPRPPAVDAFLERLRAPRAELRPSVEEARAACRDLALALFEEWHRARRLPPGPPCQPPPESALRAELAAGLYAGHAEVVIGAAERLRARLGWAAATDTDLRVADAWLREQTAAAVASAAEGRRKRVKLLLTASPIVAALLLTGLLAVVLAGA